MKRLTVVLLFAIAVNLNAQHLSSVKTDGYELTGNKAVRLTAIIDIPEDYHLAYNENYLTVKLVGPPRGVYIGKIIFPEGQTGPFYNDQNSESEKIINYYGSVELETSLHIDETAKAGDIELKIAVYYQMCDDVACYPPKEEIHRVYMTVDPPGAAPQKILLYLLMALIGGLILNFTPCVLPVLSIKAMSVIKQSGLDRGKIFLNSWLYVLGVIISLMLLALITVALKLSGEFAGFSFQNQNPQFNIFLVSLLVVFALGLWDVYLIRLPGMGKAANISSRSGYAGSFFSGVFAILLGISCTAPFLGTALGAAFALPPVWIFVFFFFIGIGLSLPFIILGFYPGIVQKLPKPGKWMNIFKDLMGFGLLIFAVQRLSVLRILIGDITFILYFLVFLALVFWIFGLLNRPDRKKTVQTIGLIFLIAAVPLGVIFILPEEKLDNAVASSGKTNEIWQEFSPDLLEYYRADGQPVFIDFTAEWCLNCKVNENTVLRTEVIESAFLERGVQLMVADYTAVNEYIADLIASYGKASVPVYAFYPKWAAVPVILPELLTKKMITDMLDEYLPLSAENGSSSLGTIKANQSGNKVPKPLVK